MRMMKAWIRGLLLAATTLLPLGAADYVVDPQRGSDSGDGTAAAPWQSFEPLNARALTAGDCVTVHPGRLSSTLAPRACGSAEQPVRIRFLPGRYDWEPAGLLRRRLAISNTNDCPEEPKAIAMELAGVRHLRVEGKQAHFFCRGKMVQIHLEEAADVCLSGFSFDYARPTVSEYRVTELGEHHALCRVHADSAYRLEGGRLIWVGEGWELPSEDCWAQVVRDVNTARRGAPLLGRQRLRELEPGLLRAEFERNPGLELGCGYQERSQRRDGCGVFCERSERIRLVDVEMNFMHGMGIVCQFSQDLRFSCLRVVPSRGRTAAAWADILHCSGCMGQLVVEECLLSAANDDAINVHGTHLRLSALHPDRCGGTLRFCHPQTFGFAAFREGDAVQFTDGETLLPLGEATVRRAELSADGRSMELRWDAPAPETCRCGRDVLENLSATPALTVRHCMVRGITTRGFLVTTRRPVRIIGNGFVSTGMPALLIENDANYWFESGPVQDMEIRGNRFIRCAEPVICFNPQVLRHAGAVHRNIRIEDNDFELLRGCALGLRATEAVSFLGNRCRAPEPAQAPLIRCDHSPQPTTD